MNYAALFMSIFLMLAISLTCVELSTLKRKGPQANLPRVKSSPVKDNKEPSPPATPVQDETGEKKKDNKKKFFDFAKKAVNVAKLAAENMPKK